MKTFVLLIFCTLPLTVGYATATQECRFHAAYFNAVFTNNYGHVDRAEWFTRDLSARMYVIVRIDSLLRSLRREGKLEHFVRWEIIDHYVANLKLFGKQQPTPGSIHIEGQKVYLSLIDSVAVNKALKKLWHVADVVISTRKSAGMWLYSLHIRLFSDRKRIMPYIERDVFNQYERSDTNHLWLKIEGDLVSTHHFYQHEKDGYHHMYTGLYLTTRDVLEAQRSLLEQYNLKTTVTSHWITPAIIRKYAYY